MFEAPYPPYDPTDPNGFSFQTVAKRWPIILAGIVDQLSQENHELHIRMLNESGDAKTQTETKIREGKAIIEQVSKLKYQMARDHVMEPIPDDDEPHVQAYNSELERLAESKANTWFTAPWLFAECYLYRLIRSILARTSLWKAFDPFFAQKIDVFKKSSKTIYQLAALMAKLEDERNVFAGDDAKIKLLFEDMLQMCLWGNATDLSLLTHHSLSDIEALQSVGKDESKQQFILKDDQESVWDHIASLRHGRIDFVLDNAGFEVFTDLVFADFLVTYSPYFSKAVFHPKLIPWFVSDVTPKDFYETIDFLLDPSFFPATTSDSHLNINRLASRWKSYVDQGIFALSVPLHTQFGSEGLAEFWTTPWAYWDIKIRDNALWNFLADSQLVIFKGDLNYRKLTGDIQWPAWTSFETAIGPLAGSFPILSLRTNKADVVVGVPRDVATRLDEENGTKWRVDGRYALISFAPKT